MEIKLRNMKKILYTLLVLFCGVAVAEDFYVDMTKGISPAV